MTNQSIEDRLRAIEDRLEIYNLIASHPPSADTGADYFTCVAYTPDGVIDLGGGKSAEGNEAVAAIAKTPGHQAAIAGGIAIGSWGWGHLTDLYGVEAALLVSAGLMLASPLLGIWLRMPPVGARYEPPAEALADPEVRLSLTGRSGPLVVEIEYRVAQDNARAFHNVMQEVQLSRQRNGAYGWSIARDIADPELWTERYHCPTWHDYLRQRNRPTAAERQLTQSAQEFHIGEKPVRIRRMLERPFGSVRWKDETPDRAVNEVLPVTTAAGGST